MIKKKFVYHNKNFNNKNRKCKISNNIKINNKMTNSKIILVTYKM